MFNRNSMHYAAVLLAVLAGLVVGPNAALDAAPQHHDQQPGFYRLKVGDLEVTALYDGTGVFDPRWLNGTKATMDGVVKGLQEDPHMLDVVDSGFLVNTGKQLILVDAGAGTWWGGGALGRLEGSLRSAGYTPEEINIVLVTHLHSDHVGGLTTQDGKRVFPNADVYVAKAESDFWLSPEIAAMAPKDAQPFFQSAQAIAAPYIRAGKWHTFSGSESIVDGIQLVPLAGHTPGHTGYEFSSKGQKILFCGDIVHAQRVQLQHPEVTAVFDIDQTNVRGTLFTVQKALPILKDGGSIILNGPVASVKGTAAFGVCAASKAAIRSFVRTWTSDPKDRHIRSNVVSPGPINTPLASRQSPEVIVRIVSTVPMGRMGEPDEVAKVALFLASDDSSSVTGIELFVDGGRAQI